MQADTAADQRKPPFPDEATHVQVEFIPEVWNNGRAVSSDDTETFLVPVEEATTPEGKLPSDRSGESDPLRHHENAPERAQNWPDIFSVELRAFVDASDKPTVVEEIARLYG